MRIITFPRFDKHSTWLFKLLKIIKLCDLVQLHIFQFLCSSFTTIYCPLILNFFFTTLGNVHNYNIRAAVNIHHITCLEQELIMAIRYSFLWTKVWNSLAKELYNHPL